MLDAIVHIRTERVHHYGTRWGPLSGDQVGAHATARSVTFDHDLARVVLLARDRPLLHGLLSVPSELRVTFVARMCEIEDTGRREGCKPTLDIAHVNCPGVTRNELSNVESVFDR